MAVVGWLWFMKKKKRYYENGNGNKIYSFNF